MVLYEFYIADMHLGHKNVLKFDNRPFESVSEMDMDTYGKLEQKGIT